MSQAGPANSSSCQDGLLIPITIRVGVTGHRALKNPDLIRSSLRVVLARLDTMLKGAPHAFVAVSPLAEGADRLVAQEIMAWQSSDLQPGTLEVALPLPVEEYVKDFQTPESQAEFRELLALANRPQELDLDNRKFDVTPQDTFATKSVKQENRRQAYRRVGLWLVDNCDVLVAVWDGEKAKGIGGTGEVVEYAHKLHRSVVWIDAETGEIKEQKYNRRMLEAFRRQTLYNDERVAEQQLATEVERRYSNLRKQAADSGLDAGAVDPLRPVLMPNFVRTAMLAQRYQSRYLNAGTWVYILAVTSVATVTLVTLLLTDVHLPFGVPPEELIWLEVVQIIVIFVLLTALNEWHRKWIDYRFLAERLRAAMFLFVAGIYSDPPSRLGHQSVSDEWMVSALRWIRSRCFSPETAPMLATPLKTFIMKAWIESQLSFYRAKSADHERRYLYLESAGYIVFGLTAVAAVWHANPQVPFLRDYRNLPKILASSAIILPALGASISGVRSYREHFRNFNRYESMARYLSSVAGKIEAETDPVWLKQILLEANEVMMHEHQDWRVVMLPGIAL